MKKNPMEEQRGRTDPGKCSEKKRRRSSASVPAGDVRHFESETSESVNNLKEKNKKRARTALAAVLISAVVLSVLFFLPYDRILAALFPEKITDENIFFYPSDFETDILADSEYTALPRHLEVKLDGRETVAVFNDADAEKYGPGPWMLWQYFQALMQGDAEKYNSLFSESYRKEKGEQAAFPMQRIYNISAVCYSAHTFTGEELNGEYKGITQYRYEVNYCIQYNDGSVRRDMGSGESKPIYLEILVSENEGDVKINSISYKKRS